MVCITPLEKFACRHDPRWPTAFWSNDGLPFPNLYQVRVADHPRGTEPIKHFNGWPHKAFFACVAVPNSETLTVGLHAPQES